MKEEKNLIQNNNNNELKDKSISGIHNNNLMNEINELLMDEEQIKKKIIKSNNDYIELELCIKEDLTQSKFPINFLLRVPSTFPDIEPELYCITKFSYPHIYDGRNLINDVIKSKWDSSFSLDIIINRIPKFIISFNNSLEEGYLLMVGKYTINHLYSIAEIKEMPVFNLKISQNRKIKDKILKQNLLLTISDLSFCLYEYESKHYVKLIYQSNINNLSTMKRNTELNTITLFFKNKEETNEIELITEKTEKIKLILLEKMELFGKEYNVSEKIIKKKMGKLPCSNIESVEKQIESIEKDLNNSNKKINFDLVNKLMTLYQTAVEYYSAINSPLFQNFTYKIKKLMENQKINELIETNKENKNIQVNKTELPSKEKKNKEERIITQGLNKLKNKLSSLSGKRDQKKVVTKPKVSISKEDEDGGTLDVGSDDEEEEEEDEEDNNKKENIKEENKKEEQTKEENKKEEQIKEENKNEEQIKEENKKEEQTKDDNKKGEEKEKKEKGEENKETINLEKNDSNIKNEIKEI